MHFVLLACFYKGDMVNGKKHPSVRISMENDAAVGNSFKCVGSVSWTGAQDTYAAFEEEYVDDLTNELFQFLRNSSIHIYCLPFERLNPRQQSQVLTSGLTA